MTPDGAEPVDTETRVVGAENTVSFRRLDALGELSEDWDSYGGAPPTPVSLGTARSLLLKLEQRAGLPLGRDAAREQPRLLTEQTRIIKYPDGVT